jgi:hypothetical protein
MVKMYLLVDRYNGQTSKITEDAFKDYSEGLDPIVVEGITSYDSEEYIVIEINTKLTKSMLA